MEVFWWGGSVFNPLLPFCHPHPLCWEEREKREKGKKLCLVTSSQPRVFCARCSEFIHSARPPTLAEKEATYCFVSDRQSD